jgi:hypothetical protein
VTRSFKLLKGVLVPESGASVETGGWLTRSLKLLKGAVVPEAEAPEAAVSNMLRLGELVPEGEPAPDTPPNGEAPNKADAAAFLAEAIPAPVSSTGVPGPLPLPLSSLPGT